MELPESTFTGVAVALAWYLGQRSVRQSDKRMDEVVSTLKTVSHALTEATNRLNLLAFGLEASKDEIHNVKRELQERLKGTEHVVKQLRAKYHDLADNLGALYHCLRMIHGHEKLPEFKETRAEDVI